MSHNLVDLGRDGKLGIYAPDKSDTYSKMPGKHVRFAHTNVVHSPATPALSFSSFSPASSSSAPLTPLSYPMILPGPSPYARAFSQPKIVKSARVHALLQSSGPPLLNFDLRQPPSTITSHHKGISLRAFAEPATQPPLPSLVIIAPHLPWRLTVYPSHARTHGAYVTVEDVFRELYDMLRTNISAQEYHSLPSEVEKRKITAAYEQRYRCICGSREYEDEKRRGVRRVDFLMGQTRFMGLSPSESSPDVWLLHST
ncbi:hypothetical protein DXG01_015253 [Tephrocybe rancida]|nr:hypothetical protein DXG01_015253 [Tephrocybe rancida]